MCFFSDDAQLSRQSTSDLCEESVNSRQVVDLLELLQHSSPVTVLLPLRVLPRDHDVASVSR
ncbi:hypothetical protein M6B38_123045 [Iris pallida]|uniref:Uncharacterized protein n=1 Tax=Iris pallida TaxID=29817 RepID=A0AAX6H2D7_IRIPA|nr:hypothetical protein M6B38_123045 [Iris pallida]